jgi:hypothetical protein
MSDIKKNNLWKSGHLEMTNGIFMQFVGWHTNNSFEKVAQFVAFLFLPSGVHICNSVISSA